MIPKGLIGVVFGQNMYEHVGGEVRYLFQFGGPQLRQDGVQVNATGFTNTIVYDLLVHLTDREARFRPYIGGGAGIKVYTGSEYRFIGQPFDGAAFVKRHSQVEPAISVGAGLKYQVARHALIRFDFRTYMTPFPNEVLRPIGYNSKIHGWIYNFVPMGGVSVIF
jgi:hypothetical protein